MTLTNMGKNDLHLVVHAHAHVMKAFDYWGRLRWSVRCRCDGTGDPNNAGRTDLPNSDTPKGLYRIGLVYRQAPDTVDYEIYGPVFYDLEEQQNQEASVGRAGIGIHGGRDKTPGKPTGTWVDLAPTHGCVRVDNEDVLWVMDPSVSYIREKMGGTVWVTVV